MHAPHDTMAVDYQSTALPCCYFLLSHTPGSRGPATGDAPAACSLFLLPRLSSCAEPPYHPPDPQPACGLPVMGSEGVI